MTSEEAVDLAIVAGALGALDSVYWVDAGRPVRILDLARQLVEAAPAPIEIEFTGLRPGENLHEELFAEGERVSTECERVFSSALPRVDPEWLDSWTAELERLVERAATDAVQNALSEMAAVWEREPVASAAEVA
jgi:FlaA1/EpsC-like NDP-sugar epimerase